MRATHQDIVAAVLAYRDGVLESTTKRLTTVDAEQVQTALALRGKDASLLRILNCAEPFQP